MMPSFDSEAVVRLTDISSATQLAEFRHNNGTTGNKYFPETHEWWWRLH